MTRKRENDAEPVLVDVKPPRGPDPDPAAIAVEMRSRLEETVRQEVARAEATVDRMLQDMRERLLRADAQLQALEAENRELRKARADQQRRMRQLRDVVEGPDDG